MHGRPLGVVATAVDSFPDVSMYEASEPRTSGRNVTNSLMGDTWSVGRAVGLMGLVEPISIGSSSLEFKPNRLTAFFLSQYSATHALASSRVWDYRPQLI